MKPKDLAKIESAESPYSVSIFLATEKPYLEKSDFESHAHRLMLRLEDALETSGCPEEIKQNRVKRVKKELAKIDFKELSNPSKCLAVFINDQSSLAYILPIETQERIIIDQKFILREPLLSSTKCYHYWLVTITEPSIYLYHGKDGELEEQRDFEFPVLNTVQESPFERAVSSSMVSVGVHSSPSRSAGSTHLPGDYAANQDSYEEEHLKQFFRRADGILADVLKEHPYPLIIAGTERNLACFKEISNCHQSAIGFLHGSFNKTGSEELKELAAPVVEKHLSGRCANALEEFQDALGHKKTAQGIQEVWQTVQEGRCKVLMMERDFYNFAGTTEGDISLDLSVDKSASAFYIPDNLEALIRKARRMGGEIIFFEPDQLKLYDRVAAILRY